MSEDTKTETVAAAELRSFLERIERLSEQKDEIRDDIKDVYSEAKGRGYDTKAMRKLVRIRKQDKNQRIEEEAVLEAYKSALGIE